MLFYTASFLKLGLDATLPRLVVGIMQATQRVVMAVITSSFVAIRGLVWLQGDSVVTFSFDFIIIERCYMDSESIRIICCEDKGELELSQWPLESVKLVVVTSISRTSVMP